MGTARVRRRVRRHHLRRYAGGRLEFGEPERIIAGILERERFDMVVVARVTDRADAREHEALLAYLRML